MEQKLKYMEASLPKEKVWKVVAARRNEAN